jgi:hypothetical protein
MATKKAAFNGQQAERIRKMLNQSQIDDRVSAVAHALKATVTGLGVDEQTYQTYTLSNDNIVKVSKRTGVMHTRIAGTRKWTRYVTLAESPRKMIA